MSMALHSDRRQVVRTKLSGTPKPAIHRTDAGGAWMHRKSPKHEENWRKRKKMQENEDFCQPNLGLMFDL